MAFEKLQVATGRTVTLKEYYRLVAVAKLQCHFTGYQPPCHFWWHWPLVALATAGATSFRSTTYFRGSLPSN